MSFWSQSTKAFPGYVAFTSFVVLTASTYAGADYSSFVLSINVTRSDPMFNETVSFNQTTVLPDQNFLYDDILWPEDLTSPKSSSLSASPTSSPSPRPGLPRFNCNGKAFGKNLNVASCLDALNRMPSNDEIVIFGERHRGTWGGNLPYRILSIDGLCALDLSHRAGAYFDSITPRELKENARALINICVKGNPNEGGVVSNIGYKGDLAIRVIPYRPSVHCSSSEPSYDFRSDCRLMIDEMPVDGTRQIFGQRNDPDPEITVKIPFGFTTRRKRCSIYFDTMVPGDGKDAYDWYKFCT